MTTSFIRALRLLSTRVKRDIKSALKFWASDHYGSTIVLNLEVEHFLTQKSMAALLSEISKHSKGPSRKIAKAFQSMCYQHQLKGGSIRTESKPSITGHAFDKPTFINSLVVNHPSTFPTRYYAEDFVRRLVSGSKLLEAEQDLTLSNYTMWATWSDDFKSKDPFDFSVSGRANEIRAVIGLDPKSRKLPLLLIAYGTNNLGLFRPTVADAGLYRQFRPPEKNCTEHGRTIPWEKGHLPVSMQGFSLNPRPEAVHRPIKFRSFLAQVREISP